MNAGWFRRSWPLPALRSANRPSGAAAGDWAASVAVSYRRGCRRSAGAGCPPVGGQLGEADVGVGPIELLGGVEDARCRRPARSRWPSFAGFSVSLAGRPWVEGRVAAGLGIREGLGVTAARSEERQAEHGERSPPGGCHRRAMCHAGPGERAGMAWVTSQRVPASTRSVRIPGFSHPASEHDSRDCAPRAFRATGDRNQFLAIQRRGGTVLPYMSVARRAGGKRQRTSNKESAWTYRVHRPIAVASG